MKEESREYTVITSAWRWGKGNTPTEAAKNACVTGKSVRGILFRADPRIIDGEIHCNDMGDPAWNWQPEALDVMGQYAPLRGFCRDAVVEASGLMCLVKGKLVIVTEWE